MLALAIGVLALRTDPAVTVDPVGSDAGALRSYRADEALSRGRPENANRSLSEMTINPDVVVPMVLLFDVPDGVEPQEAQFKGTGRSRFGVNVRLQRR